MRVVWAVLMMGALIQARAQVGAKTPGSKTAPPPEPTGSRSANFDPKGQPRSRPERKDTSVAPTRAVRSAHRRISPDTVDLGTTSITGNQELPKVLYIVPWKKSSLGDVVGRPAKTLLDEVLTPLDPPVFERRVKYYETLNRAKEKE